MRGLAALERGDVAGGRRLLDSLLAADPSYAARREVGLALGGQSLDAARWDEARAVYEAVDRDWTLQHDALRRIVDTMAFDELWEAWRAGQPVAGALALDGGAVRAEADRLAAAALDLAARPEAAAPALGRAATAPVPWAVAPPEPAEAAAVVASARRVATMVDELARADADTMREREALARQRRYLGIGADRSRDEAALLVRRVALLDSLSGVLESVDERLRRVRDVAARRVAERAARVAAAAGGDLLWMRAMRRFHLDGPDGPRARRAPQGYPGADTLMRAEERLAVAIRASAESLAAAAPGLLARSYERAWRPGLIDRAAALGVDARRSLAWARDLGTAITAAVDAAWSSDALKRLEARAARLARAADSLRAGDRALRERVARAAVDRALAGLATEREAIDYGLAASAYALGVRLGAADTTAIAVSTGGITADTEADALEDSAATRWRAEAGAALQAFLERHPGSAARGEVRFRLADVLLVDARQAFRRRMAEYVSAQSEGGEVPPLPVLSHAEALAHYRAILDQDPGFERLDAVRFNAGMILADEGDPGAETYFLGLVAEHPGSPYLQEAYLRLGDLRFNERRFAECVAFYAQAAAGPDPSLRTVALYKTGWAHFNEDRFQPAAAAFGAVLDLYASPERSAVRVDVEREAESYLVHALARSGGAEAFAAHFDSAAGRPYEMRVLRALATHFRRYSLHEEAAAVEALGLARWPDHPDALAGAGRLIDTYRRWDRPERAREALAGIAPRFGPGGSWWTAQPSDSARAAGAAFARSAWLELATHHHREARASGAPAAWREALRHYEAVLRTWPDDAEAPVLRLRAGEASARLDDPVAALRHYAEAARTGPDSVAAQALWQRVAVTDAWYERARAAARPGEASLGRDSLARAVHEASDAMRARFPAHEKLADLDWRSGNLALAHGWHERAAEDFGRLATRHPGDARAPAAAERRGDALFWLGRFADAGEAYEQALATATRAGAGADSIARRARAALPICAFREAEAAVAADSTAYARHAMLFERVATRFPAYQHAALSQYRAGLAHFRAGDTREGVRAMEALIAGFPKSDLRRDAHLEIARAWDARKERERAAEAYADFAARYPHDAAARDAWLRGADLFAEAGRDARADTLRLAYVRRYPDDHAAAMEIYEALARRDLASVGPGRPLASLLDKPRAKRAARAPSHLAEYLRRAAKHPDLAAKGLIAEVRFKEGEEAREPYAAAKLRLPLKKSLAAKQSLLDAALGRYRACADLGVAEWAHAAAFRIGEALVSFGEALEASERPADLSGDDLRAYDEVLLQQAQAFHDRGEGVWTDLLKQVQRGAADDPWVAQARTALWNRLGDRFYFRPEVEYPRIAGARPEPKDEVSEQVATPKGGAAGKAPRESRRARREGQP
jgi:TolA-binding protein